MKKVTITVIFNQSGHGCINVIPSNYNQWNPVASSSTDYNLDPGVYTITFLTATMAGGAVTVTQAGHQLAHQQLSAGVDGGNFTITI